VGANDSAMGRLGTVTFLAGELFQAFTVEQDGAPPPPEATLSLSTTSWPAPESGGDSAFTVSTTDSFWTAWSNQGWLTISKSMGADGDQVTATAQPNTGLSPRTATVTVNIPRGKSATYTVTQAAATQATLSTNVTGDILAPGEGNAYGVFVTTNQGSYNVTANSPWLRAEKWPGSDTYFVIYVDANDSQWMRRGTITVTAGSAAPVTIAVNQGGSMGPSLTIGRTSWEQSMDAGDAGFYVYTNQGTWTATADVPWLSVSRGTGASGDWLVVHADSNDTGEVRTGTVTVTAGTQTATFTVTQYGLRLQ